MFLKKKGKNIMYLPKEGKLVRDKIPQIIGKNADVQVLSNENMLNALLLKLVEEAKEAQATTNVKDLTGELADVFEVLEHIQKHANITNEAVYKEKQTKNLIRGSFYKKFWLNTW